MPDISEWDMKVAEWRGYTLKALEDMNGEIKENSKKLVDMEKEFIDRFNKIDAKLTAQMIKVGVIGGTMGLITGTAITYLWHALLGI